MARVKVPRKTEPKEPAKVGRPTAYRKDYPDLARKFCLLGATNAELANSFDVSMSTIDKWIREIPAFSRSVKAGRKEADANVADRLYARATGYSHQAVKIFMPAGAEEPVHAPYTEHYPPDATSAIFWLKNRRRNEWRDRSQTELTGAGGGPIEIEHRQVIDLKDVAPEQRQLLRQALVGLKAKEIEHE